MPFGCRVSRDGAFRTHRSDGLVFVPDTPYIAGTDHSLLKWKARDQLTVDLTVRGAGKARASGFSRWTTTAATSTVRNMCICRSRTPQIKS